MSSREQFLRRFITETIYLIYDFEKVVIRCDPKDGCFIKFKGKEEHSVDSSNRLVVEAIIDPKEISKEQYDNY